MAGRMVALNPSSSFFTRETSNLKLSLDWSLRPITIWTRIFGIPLFVKKLDSDDQQHQSTCISYFPISLTFLILNLGCNTYVIMLAASSVESKNKTVTTKTWNNFINDLNFCFLTTLSHSALLIMSALAWKGLPDALYRLEQLQYFDQNYKKFRRIFTIGSLLLSLVYIFINFGLNEIKH